MKKLLLILFYIMLLNNSGFAQEGKYHKFVKEGMEWYNIVTTTHGGSWCTYYYLYGKYQIKGDTLFNGVHYNILFYDNKFEDDGCQSFLFIREDTLQKKVYLLIPFISDPEEYIMYDFSVSIEDSTGFILLLNCEAGYLNLCINDKEVVSIIDYYNDGKENRNQIITTSYFKYSNIVEGIGCVNSSTIYCGAGEYYYLLYAKYGEDTLYINREYQDAINSIKEGNTWNKTVCTGINENEIDKNTRFVFFNNTIIDNENKIGMYYLYNTQGALINKANYNKEINLEYLKTGLYLINILTENSVFKMKILINKEL